MEHTDYKDRLQAEMDKLGIDRARLAKLLGISYQAVRKVFESNGKFGVANNLKAAEYFNVSPGWLANGRGQRDSVSTPLDQSPAAQEIAALYDMIPATDRIRRAQAYNGATAAIVEVLERHSTSEPSKDQKKQSA